MTAHIYVYSPAGAVRDRVAFRRGVQRLRRMGYSVEVDADALRSHQRFAGDDAVRLRAVQRACASGADVAMISRGGYGISRLLTDLDYPALADAIARGTRFIGMSDFTFLQCALLARTGAISWSGPVVGEDFGALPEPDETMQACFDDWVCQQTTGTGWRPPRLRLQQQDAQLAAHYARASASTAVLWGGNLSSLAALVGTPYLPDINQGILFLEDVHEHPYRVERLLCQLLWSGVLQKQKAVLLGAFTGYKSVPHDRGYSLKTVLAWLQAHLSPLQIPVLTDLPFGHVPTKVVLPFGLPVQLHLQGHEAFLLWDHAD